MIRKFMIVILGFLAFYCFFSCEKKHLDPILPEGTDEPVVYITAKLDNDSIYLAGGINDYAGNTSVTDSLNHYRTFHFTLEDVHLTHPSFQVSINNYQTALSDHQSDLSHSIFVDERHYQYPENIDHFIPLAVTITWIDATGKEFSSAKVEQIHLFHITAVEDVVFEGRDYKKVSVEFDCRLENDGTILHLTEGKATLLFSSD